MMLHNIDKHIVPPFVVRLVHDESCLGTGVLVSENTVITCAHVILAGGTYEDWVSDVRCRHPNKKFVTAGSNTEAPLRKPLIVQSSDAVTWQPTHAIVSLEEDFAVLYLEVVEQRVATTQRVSFVRGVNYGFVDDRRVHAFGFEGVQGSPRRCRPRITHTVDHERVMTLRVDMGAPYGFSGAPCLIGADGPWLCLGLLRSGGDDVPIGSMISSDRLIELLESMESALTIPTVEASSIIEEGTTNIGGDVREQKSRRITIATSLCDWLEKDEKAWLDAVCDNFERHVLVEDGERVARMPFFPDYADDRCAQLNSLIGTAANLIPERERLTSREVLVLVCAVVFHDIALHLEIKGFSALVEENSRWTLRGKCSDQDRPWHDLWRDYADEVCRFGDKELETLLGKWHSAPQWAFWTGDKLAEQLEGNFARLLIAGEFIRRHHSRLAYECACVGFPGPGGRPIQLLTEPLPFGRFRESVGFVARSPGFPLRESVASDYGRPGNVDFTYLMAALRIADYFQIDKRTVPTPVLLHCEPPVDLATLRDLAGVKAVTIDDQVKPSNHLAIVVEEVPFRVFQLMKKVALNLKSELHECAAELHTRGLKYTHARDNFRDPRIISTLPYLPDPSELGADPGIVELMVVPLYGPHPEVGIRELLQNSLDAVRERRALQGIHPESKGKANDWDVRVTLDTVESKIVVEDQGIGMTAEVLDRYFLRAGASFRNSEQWFHDFGRMRNPPLRSGRFGIGVLAAFLLGPELVVETRHVSAKPQDILRCKVSRGSTLLAIERPYLDPAISGKQRVLDVGTRIEVKLSHERVARLKDNPTAWDWYTLAWPRVTRHIVYADNADERCTEKPLPARLAIDADQMRPPSRWRRIVPDGFDAVHWTYKKDDTVAAVVTCNGIHIARVSVQKKHRAPSLEARYWWSGNGTDLIREPRLSVYDSRGMLPLDLQRYNIQYLPFEPELLEDIVSDLIAFILIHAPTVPVWQDKGKIEYGDGHPRHPCCNKDKADGIGPLSWFCTSDGVGIADPAILSFGRCTGILCCGRLAMDEPRSPVWWPQPFAPPDGNGIAYVPAVLKRSSKTERLPWEKIDQLGCSAPYHAVRKGIVCQGEGPRRKTLRNVEGYDGMKYDGCLPVAPQALASFDPNCFCLMLELGRQLEQESLISKTWKKAIGERLIPFHSRARQQLIAEVKERDKRVGMLMNECLEAQ